ncbi:DUF2530 domain-containing protein [Propionicicella superfundia]|uniref:DUF2530 domain-containing protein n=1 Tax=Propionicicella superfundia TaxID=348582 RepID=UPI0006874C5C|nr:DUF2530 domain-containing protein [Propionicicella superfundia]
MARPEPLLVQAPVKALDEDGLNVAIAGTVVFAVAAVVLAVDAETLERTGHQWWLWVALTGTGIGVAFLAYCLIRRLRRARRNAGE